MKRVKCFLSQHFYKIWTRKWLLTSCFCIIAVVNAVYGQVNLKTKYLALSLNNKGEVSLMQSIRGSKNYLARSEPAPLLIVRTNGKYSSPQKMKWVNKSSEIILYYPENISATVRVGQKSGYLTFELKRIDGSQPVELVVWGPYPTTIKEIVGETVGVVRDKEFGIGIQALNIKTLGGYPVSENDVEPSYDIFQTGSLVDIGDKEMDRQLYRGDVAKLTEFGSVIQAYCRNRQKDRVISNWDHEQYYAPAFQDGGVTGSKIALFGAPASEILNVLEEIELNEALPHPMVDGVWGKRSANATASYLIMGFGENNIADALTLTGKAGLEYLYHPGPFETWGGFKLNPKEFPNNWEGLKKCVKTAREKNLRLGVHTLSNFITTNDPYVTPIPDKRLAKVGFSALIQDINASATEIPIKDPSFFNQMKNNTLRSVVVGNEIIRYGSVSEKAPWKLLDCGRGAFGTTAAPHNKNDSIGKLMDHAYKVFLTNYSLQEEMAETIARLFNETGLMQISFDGLEGCSSSGMGQYARQLFAKTWYDHLKPELKGKIINDASMPGHFFWHIYTRMNWGEPWYAGFRESQLQYRLKNQEYFRRNLMPAMLGWFSMKAETTPEDIEWLLARAAGFDAGFGLSTSIDAVRKNGMGDKILALIKEWETARLQGAFTESQKKKLRNIKHEFHLEPAGDNQWMLTLVYNAHFIHEQKIKQPGEPVFSVFEFDNPAGKQPISFIITPVAGKGETNSDVRFDQPGIEINNHDLVEIPVSLKANEILVCDGKEVKLYNKQWQLLQTIALSRALPLLGQGKNRIVFDGRYTGDNGPAIKVEIRAKGEAELVKKELTN